MYRFYRKMTINGHFSIESIHFCLDTIFLGSILYCLINIQNHAIMNHIIKRSFYNLQIDLGLQFHIC